MIEAKEILNFIEIENIKKKKEFIKRITADKVKQAIFNDRFFDGKSYTVAAYDSGISEAMAIHIYRDLMVAIEAHIYLQEKIYEYKDTGNNQNIICLRLPLSNRLRMRIGCVHLHELTALTEQQFWTCNGVGKKSLEEIKLIMSKFGLTFREPLSIWKKIYSLKK